MSLSDIEIVLPEFQAPDIFQKVGGFHTLREIHSDVTAVFLPGTIVGSDSSDSYRDQYRKVFVKNVSTNKTAVGIKLYGFNIKRSNIVKMALEKGQDQLPMIDGSEVIATYLTAPSLYGAYSFTELQSDHAVDIGNGGILGPGKGQGVWLRQRCPKNVSDDSSDVFALGLIGSEI